MEILTSNNYKKFALITGNRQTNEKKVEKLIADIKAGLNLLPYCPIIVFEKDGKFSIVDGQHRFEACKRLKHAVHYVTCGNLELKHIARVNSRSDKWKNADFLMCYIELDNSNYVRLYDFMKEYKVIYSASVDLLMFGTCSRKGGGMELFRDGEFIVNYYDEAVELLELTFSIFERYKFWNDRHLITAVQKLQKAGKADFTHLRGKVKQAPNEMEKQSSAKDYLNNIERVYNYKNSKRQTIY